MPHRCRFMLFSAPLLLVSTLLLAQGVVAADLHSPSAAGPANKELAQEHLARGIQEYRAGRYKDAIDAFQRANELYASAAISFNIARAYDNLEDAAAALRFYRDYLRQEPNAKDAARVSERIEQLEDQLRLKGVQQVTVASQPSGATLSLDGRPVGITPWTGELPPGNHELELRHRGFVAKRQRFELSPHRALDLEYALDARPPPRVATPAVAAPVHAASEVSPPSTSSFVDYLPWLSWGAAVVSFAGAGYFELSSAGSEGEARRAPTQVAALEHIHDMENAQTAARVFLGVGSALAVTGGVLLWVSSRDSAESGELALGCRLAGCALQGAF